MRCPSYRNDGYLRYVRDHVSCLHWDSPSRPYPPQGESAFYHPDIHWEPTVAAHVRMGGSGGVGLKPSDYRTVPLTDSEHRQQHQVGEKAFWRGCGVDPFTSIIALLRVWVGEEVGAALCEKYAGDDQALVAALEAAAEGQRKRRKGA